MPEPKTFREIIGAGFVRCDPNAAQEHIVSILEFRGAIIVATNHSVYQLQEGGEFKELLFVEAPPDV